MASQHQSRHDWLASWDVVEDGLKRKTVESHAEHSGLFGKIQLQMDHIVLLDPLIALWP